MLQTTFALWDQSKANLAETVTVITGAARGMGKETALELLRIGARVAIVDMIQERLDTAMRDMDAWRDRVLAIKADVTKPSDVQSMLQRVLDRFGQIDNLVNCAGAYKAKSPSLSVDDAEWDLIVESNLKATFQCCRAVLPHMVARHKGSIVNISSLAGRTCSPFLGVHYSAAKAGVLGVTRHLANEFGRHGIRVNSVTPGTMLGERVSEIASDEGLSAQVNATPLGRLATPPDIAGVILFLLSDLAQFVTGATIDVNGGVLTI